MGILASRAALLNSESLNLHKVMKESIIPGGYQDELLDIIKNDKIILEYGNDLCHENITKTSNRSHNNVRQKLRMVAKILQLTREIDRSITDLTSLFCISKFPALIKATQTMSNYDSRNGLFETPSNAMNIGFPLKRCAQITLLNADIEGDQETHKNVTSWLNMFKLKYHNTISKPAKTMDRIKKIMEKKELPSAEDLQRLNTYVTKHNTKSKKVLQTYFDKN